MTSHMATYVSVKWGWRGRGELFVEEERIDVGCYRRGVGVGVEFGENVAHVFSAEFLDYETEKSKT